MIKGVVMNSAVTAPEEAERVGASWFHRGGQVEPVFPGLESVPGLQFGHETDPIGGSSRYLLTWNEPYHEQHPSAEDGAKLWYDLLEPLYAESAYAPQYKLVAPGISWRKPWVQKWFDYFRAQYGRWPRFWAVNVHGYSYPGRDVVAEFQAAYDWAHGKGKELWIGEYAALPDPGWTEAQMLAEAQRVLDWAQDHATRLAWFNTRTRGDEPWAGDYNAPLYEYGSGALTASGTLYAAWGPA